MTQPFVSRRVNWSTLTATHAQQRSDQAAIRFQGQTITWGQLDDRVNRLANWLSNHGVAEGDRIALITLNQPEFLETLIAAARLGAIAVPLNFRLSREEVSYILTNSEPNAIVVDSSLTGLIADKIGKSWSGAEILVINSSETELLTHATPYANAISTLGDKHPAADVDENSPAMILYTSGTTGYPKGAVLTHLNLFVQGITNIRAFRMFGDEIVMVATPLFHIAAIASVIPVMIIGGTTVVHPVGAFNPKEVIDVLEQEEVTSVFFVPTQWQAIIDDPSIAQRDLALRVTSWGASPATTALLEKMTRTFPGAVNVATFGQTEMSPVTCILNGEDATRKLGSVGKPVSFVQVRIVDEDMRDVPVGEVGEIVYRGPNLMLEYWRSPEATETAFEGGWFHSGDLVRSDEEGFIYVVDRKKDMIISGGENIYCAEIENAIAAHEAVSEVAVIGRKDERWGEVPVAVIVPREGYTFPDSGELNKWLSDRLASYKRPKYIEVVEELPRNASGKIQKNSLRKTYS